MLNARSLPAGLLFWLFGMLLLTACATADAAGLAAATPTPRPTVPPVYTSKVQLAPDLLKVMGDAKYKNSSWALLVEDLETGEVLYELNPDQLMVPASTTKLFSTAAALDALGADYRFTTPIYQTGTLAADGTLTGDLILVASGDLTMGGRTNAQGHIAITDLDHGDANEVPGVQLTPQDPAQGFDELAKQVAAAGIKKVSGDVIVDARLFDTLLVAKTTVSPMAINENLIDVIMMPGLISETAKLDWRPQTALFKITNKVVTVAEGEPTNVEVSSPHAGEILVTGQISRDVGQLVRTYAVTDPARFGRTLFIEALERAGVDVTANAVAENPADALPANYANAKEVAKLVSPPFAENLKLTNKVSQNFDANMLPLLLAMKNGKTTYPEGMALMADFLKKAGVDMNGISLADGQGADPGDYISPRAEVQLLRYMETRPDFATYMDSLPILGVDGTLAEAAPPNSPVIGKVSAKTGTLAAEDLLNQRIILQSKALAGYMTTASGRKLVLSVFVGQTPVSDIETAIAVGNDIGRMAEILYLGN